MSARADFERRAGAAPGLEPIAIIGMACLFPQAPDLSSFWQNIVGGVDAVSEPAAAWDAARYLQSGRIKTAFGGYLKELFRFDPALSVRLRSFVDHVHTVITIHGFGRRGYFTTLLVGGQNRDLAHHVGHRLRHHLPAYEIATDLDRIPKELQGLHPKNPVNLPAKQGVQIELPPRVRGTTPMFWDWEGPGLTPHTQALVDGLVDAVDTWPH